MIAPSTRHRPDLLLAAALLLLAALGPARAAPDGPAEADPWPEPAAAAAPSHPPAGNPLWAIPRESLSATRDHPLFTPSRRPLVVDETPPVAAAPPPPPPPAAPAQPALKLVGTVVSGRDGFGLFVDGSGKTPIRLKTGETHDGWELRGVSPREATLRSSHNTVVLKLPEPAGSARSVHGPAQGSDTSPAPAAARPTRAVQIRVPRRAAPSPLDNYPDH